MMNATFTRLTSRREWGLRVTGAQPSPGQTVTVTRRDGQTTAQTIGEIVWSGTERGEDVFLCTIQKENEQPAPAAPPAPTAPIVQAAPVAPTAPIVQAAPAAPTARALPRHKRGFLLSDLTFIHESAPRGMATLLDSAQNPLKLETVGERLRDLRQQQRPVDYDRAMNRLHVAFDSGRMEASFTDGTANGSSFLFTRHGASQAARAVLPGHFWSGLRKLAQMDTEGADLAGKTWQKFARNETQREKIRTLTTELDGEVVQIVRTVQSRQYAVYDNIDLVNDMVQFAGEYGTMPVIDWWVTDEGMRIRLHILDSMSAMFAHFDREVLMHKPIPTIELWNSEVGRRSAGIRAGLYRAVSATGISCWSDRMERTWQHRGNSVRIRSGVQNTITEIIALAKEIGEVYEAALTIPVENVEAYLAHTLSKQGANDTLIAAAKTALSDPTNTPTDTLARVVDAIALAAGGYNSLFGREEIERMASRVLKAGYDTYQRTDEPLRVEEKK